MMYDESIANLQAKIHRLEDFVVRLRNTADVQGAHPGLNEIQRNCNAVLATVIVQLLRIGSSEEIEQCYEKCQEKMAEV
jgi:hypothetical protein